MRVNIAKLIEQTESEGPGVRAALWVQGCSIQCEGCVNPHLWAFVDRHWVDTSTLAHRLMAIPNIEGITLLGGEPFDQAAGLAELSALVRESGLSVMTFSGYTLEQLNAAKRADYTALIAASDILVDGPFILERRSDTMPWIGSDNQRIHFLTDRYRHWAALLESASTQRLAFSAEHNTMEIRIDTDGKLVINGYAYTEAVDGILESLRTEGYHVHRAHADDL